MRELLPFIRQFRPYWLPLLLGLLLTLFTLLTGIGLLSLSGWFLSASAIAGLQLASRQSFNYLLPAGGVRFLSIGRTASRWAERVVTHDVTFRLLCRLRVMFWQKLAPMPASRLTAFRHGDLLNRLISDIDALDQLYLRLLTPLLSAALTLTLLFGFVQLFAQDLAWQLVGGLALSGLLLPSLMYLAGRKPGQQLVTSRTALRSEYLDYLDMQAEWLLFGVEDQQKSRLLQAEQTLLDAQKTMSWLSGTTAMLLTLASGALLMLMLWSSAPGVGGHQPDALIALMVFMTLAAFEAIGPLLGAGQHLPTTLAAAQRLNAVLQDEAPVVYGQQSLATDPTRIELHLHDLHFGYPAGPRILNGFSLTLAAGEKVALLGPTGTGKSTLLGLITREWAVSQGQILLNGQPLDQLSETALRSSMAVVSQRVAIFSATLADNLRLAKPAATDAELLALLQRVGLGHLLDSQPPEQGLKQWLGEGGRPLSGGEQRRIGVARALLHDSPLLLLDEATEGLDPATEQAILDVILQHASNKTVLMITHRPAGLSRMDRVALLDQGQVRLRAPHATLLAQDPDYRQLHRQLTL